MPITIPAALQAHLDGETTTLCTLWTLIRTDGVTYRFTDHDTNVVFGGETFECGIGYDRTAIEDKADLSPDNMDVKGILDTSRISRRDIRAGLFDGAEVQIRVINYKNPGAGAVYRRRGWLGEVRQNNLGQFDTELRGLSEALSESLSRVYTPGCSVDLGSVGLGQCNRKMVPDLRASDTEYETGEEVRIDGIDDLIFRCTTAGFSSDDASFDQYAFDVYEGDTVSDGTLVWTAFGTWGKTATATSEDRRTFNVTVDEPRLATDPTFYNGGLAVCLTGDNAGLSAEIKSYSSGSVTFYLRWPFNIQIGDTFTFYPGCPKDIATCNSRFGNSKNFQGFPHVPGDDWLKSYPTPK